MKGSGFSTGKRCRKGEPLSRCFKQNGIWLFKIVEMSGKREGHITFQEPVFVTYKADDQGI